MMPAREPDDLTWKQMFEKLMPQYGLSTEEPSVKLSDLIANSLALSMVALLYIQDGMGVSGEAINRNVQAILRVLHSVIDFSAIDTLGAEGDETDGE